MRLVSTTIRHCSSVRSSIGDGGTEQAGVVEEEVDSTEVAPDLHEQVPHGGRIGHVGGHYQRLPWDRCDRLLEGVATAAGDGDAVAGDHQLARHRAADPGTGSGDDGNALGLAHHAHASTLGARAALSAPHRIGR